MTKPVRYRTLARHKRFVDLNLDLRFGWYIEKKNI